MRICKVWDADYPWDVRVARIAGSLVAAGHEVHLVARNKLGRPVQESLPEAVVHRLRPWPLGSRLSRASMFPAFFNPRWLAAIHRTARRERAQVILVRDLPLAPAAIGVGRFLGLPVVLDMAENYPAMTRQLYEYNVERPWDVAVRNPALVRATERWVLRHVDRVLVVVEESRDRLVGLGYPEERITIVGNTPPLARLSEHAARAHAPGPLHLCYLGLLEAPRGLDVVLDALPGLVTCGAVARLNIIGDGRDRRRFEFHAARLGLGPPVVQFLGRLPNAEALHRVAEADVGLIPHPAGEFWNSTIPNKLFDYMAAGLAIVSSNARPAARIVRATETGEVYDSADPSELAAAIERLLDPTRRSLCAQNGREAIRDRYHWEADCARMLTALESVVGARHAGPRV